jgi:hypothetical protein
MWRVSSALNNPGSPDSRRLLAEDAVDSIGVHMPPRFLLLAIMTKWAKQWPVEVVGVACRFQIRLESFHRIRTGDAALHHSGEHSKKLLAGRA